MMHVRAAVLAAAPAAAQTEAPTCAERGQSRLAVMVPPGRTEDEIRDAARSGALAPQGTEVFILPAGHFTRMRNGKQHGERMNGVLRGLLNMNMQVEGSGTVLMRLDESGAVAEVRPNTGSGHLDRQLARVWRQAEWEPYVIGGCRMAAWIHVPLSFRSDQSYSDGGSRHQIEVRPGSPR
jgi:hypothetical protein